MYGRRTAIKVLVKEKIAQAGIDKLKAAGFKVDVRIDMSADELVEEISNYDALIIRSATKVTEEVINRANNLKVIGRAGIGVDNVNLEAATKRGIIIANAPQSNIVSAAEHTIALMLACARNIPQACSSTRAGKWERSKFQGVEVYEKTLGIIGLGRIGTLVASRAHGLGMKVIAYDPYVAKERYTQLGIERAAKIDDVLKVADFLTVHLPKSKETLGLIGDRELAIMKDGVRLINTARGGIYQLEPLLNALKSGKVAGISFDVFDQEPLTESPLFDFDQVVCTPHLGASTIEAQDRAGTMIAEQVIAGLKGEFVSNAVNIPLIPVEAMEAVKLFLPLAEKLGKLFNKLADKGMHSIEVEYVGPISKNETKLLTIAVLKGIFDGVVEEQVNYVNAPIFAEERGIEVRESTKSSSQDYINVIRLRGRDGDEDVSVAGTLVGKKNQERFVNIYEFDIDMVPSKYMAFFRYEDVPGMIGKVGTILGDHSINIANMQVGRKKIGGEALMGINVDTPIPDEVIEDIKSSAGISFAKFMVL
ncbi:MAG: phosphoglycerate dehydrogenase [Actinobacteria bacterium]|nr:phosphoglycerate dehydrogenase [Actinomycetota bacterium]